VAEVTSLDLKLDDNHVVAFRTKLKVSLEFHPER
jgi:flavin-binding protein dodecin